MTTKSATKAKPASKASAKTTTKTSTRVSAKDKETFDFSVEDAKTAFLPALQEKFCDTRKTLTRLGTGAPQVLLLEGGVEAERQSMALWWAALQHCTQRQEDNTLQPCGTCGQCLHIGVRIHPDVLAYDGRISNTADEENPGPVRALNKNNAVTLKGKLGDTTRSGQKRVIIISGIEEGSRSSAANALLKVLEEPSPVNIFVLLTAQREQILPTLVSRSFVYTLPWPATHKVAQELDVWEQALAAFLRSGQEWWKMTSTKGAVTPQLASQVLLLCQKRLITASAGEEQNPHGGALSPFFAKFSAQQHFKLSQIIDTANEALLYNVTPSRILDTLAVDMYTLLRTEY